MEKLIIKNFGAIRDIAIDLKDLIVFIGETGTGKSTLAKLIAIFRSEDFWRGDANFLKYLSYYQIRDFLQNSTFIEYQSEMGIFVYNEGKGDAKFPEDVLRKLGKFTNITDQEAQEDKIGMLLTKFIESVCNEIIYIPAARGAVSFLSLQHGKELTHIIPNMLLKFIEYFNKVSLKKPELKIDLFDVIYQKENGKDYIALPDDKRFLLSESASGLQTLIPTLLIFEYFSQDEQKKNYIFEEPELNLFPITQKLLVELIAEKVLNKGHKMVITTHSPYILTALNNLVYAYQVGQKEPSKVAELVKRELWLNPQNVSSYFVEEGTIRSIVSEELQQARAEEIDKASDLINSLYDELLEIEVSNEDDHALTVETISG